MFSSPRLRCSTRACCSIADVTSTPVTCLTRAANAQARQTRAASHIEHRIHRRRAAQIDDMSEHLRIANAG